jgi:hypothetical protein
LAEIASLSVSIGADIRDLKAKMAQVEKTVKNTANDLKKEFGNNISSQISGAIAGAFAVDALVTFGKEVIAITAEFQRFEAVLSNALGSNSEAQIAMLKIQELAAKTPFSVKALTEAYVQLANRGIEPSTATMTKMGDVAATLGKDISQLNEAILDVSNSERWNELGIKVKVAGDKMTGTFKGMTVEVAKTEAGALKMIEAFGEMPTVAGAMAGISETLGGKISNLGDSMDQLYVTIGNLTGGAAVWFIDAFTEMAQVTTRLLKSTEQLNKEAHLKNIGKEVEELSARYNTLVEDAKKYQNLDETAAKQSAYSQLADEFTKLIELRQKEMDLISTEGDEQVITDQKVLDSQAERFKAAKNSLELAQAQLDALEKIKNGTNAEAEATKKAGKAKEEYTGIIAIEQKKLEELNKARMNSGTAEEVGKYNDLIAKQKEAIEVLENYTLAIEQANLTDLTPKGFDSPGVTAKTELPETWTQQFYRDLAIEMEIATNKNIAFGESFDLVGEKANILSNAIAMLLENGVSPANPIVESLRLQLESLGNTMKTVAIDISGMVADMFTTLAESFGELAVGAQSVDDFGKNIIIAVAEFAGQLGKAMIATGVAALALENVISNPYAAIAAGAVLVGLAAATRAVLKKGVTSTPSISSGAQSGSQASTTSSYIGAGSMQIFGTIKGRDIQLSSEKTAAADNRMGR